MASVLMALQQKGNALLESPTGTGKTLCLLCSALAWQQKEKDRIAQLKDGPIQLSHEPTPYATKNDNVSSLPSSAVPVIIYASRTHSQLSQVVGELRNTRYRPPHAVLGSREHMCIHPKVNPTKTTNRKTSALEVNNGCNNLQRGRKCILRNNLDNASREGDVWRAPCDGQVDDGRPYEQPILDMEDMVNVGKQHQICPFYHARSLVKDAELIFVPYNYLFDRDARESTLAEVDFGNAVLIFDEAHNLEGFASGSSSFDLSTSDLAGCVSEVERAMQCCEANSEMAQCGDRTMDNLLLLKSVFQKLERYLCEGMSGPHRMLPADSESSHPGEYIFELFMEGCGIWYGKKNGKLGNLPLFINFAQGVRDLMAQCGGGGRQVVRYAKNRSFRELPQMCLWQCCKGRGAGITAASCSVAGKVVSRTCVKDGQ